MLPIELGPYFVNLDQVLYIERKTDPAAIKNGQATILHFGSGKFLAIDEEASPTLYRNLRVLEASKGI